MGKEKKDKKNNVLAYFLMAIGLIFAAILVLIAIMVVTPNKDVFGLQYVSYSDSKTHNLTNEVSDITGFEAIKVDANSCKSVIFEPTAGTDIYLEYKQSISGLTKTVNAGVKYEVKVESLNFEGQETPCKTLNIKIYEPDGMTVKNNSIIKILIPENKQLKVVFSTSKIGSQYFYSQKTVKQDIIEKTYSFKVDSLYLKSGKYGIIDIKNNKNISNFNLTTEYGDIVFNKEEPIDATSLQVSSQKGTFNFSNEENNLEIKLSQNFTVETKSKSSMSVNIDKLLANGVFKMNSGTIRINELGSASTPKTAEIRANNTTFNFNIVNGIVNAYDDEGNLHNSITINKINNAGTDSCKLNVGRGNLVVNDLIGDANLQASTGNININKASALSNINAWTLSGQVNITYDDTSTKHDDVILHIFTESGNVNIKKISCKFEIDILEKSASSKLNLNILYLSSERNIVKANGRMVNFEIYREGKFRLCTNSQVTAEETFLFSKTEIGDEDYLLNQPGYVDYENCYRIGYAKGNESVDVTTLGAIIVDGESGVYLSEWFEE